VTSLATRYPGLLDVRVPPRIEVVNDGIEPFLLRRGRQPRQITGPTTRAVPLRFARSKISRLSPPDSRIAPAVLAVGRALAWYIREVPLVEQPPVWTPGPMVVEARDRKLPSVGILRRRPAVVKGRTVSGSISR
jgi:hypothetical protein